MTLAVVSIIYGACLALVQTDIKKIIAYSSISHLGYVMLGLVSLDLIGIQGAIIQMVSHGLTAAGLFLMVGMIYERCHTRELAAYGGLAKLLPVYSVFFMILTLASIGLPDDERLHRRVPGAARALQRVVAAIPARRRAIRWRVSASAVAGVVLGALYMLRFAQRFLFGVAKAPHAPVADLDGREKVILSRSSWPSSRSDCSRTSRCASRSWRRFNTGNRSRANACRASPPKLAGSESLPGSPR